MTRIVAYVFLFGIESTTFKKCDKLNNMHFLIKAFTYLQDC